MNINKPVYKCTYCSRFGHLENFCHKKKSDVSSLNIESLTFNEKNEDEKLNSPLSVLNFDSSSNIIKKKEENEEKEDEDEDEEGIILKEYLINSWLNFERESIERLIENSKLPDTKFKIAEKKCKFCIDYNKKKGTSLDENHWTKHPIYYQLCEKDTRYILCPLLKNHECYKCKKKGHTPTYCPLQKLKNDKILINKKDINKKNE